MKWKNAFQYFWVFDFGCRAKSKTWKPRNFFFFKKDILTFKFFPQLIFVVSESSITLTLKIWSKRTLSKIFEFSILGVGQNRKLGNLGFFFSFKSISWPLIFCLKRILSEISKFSILGVGQNWKLGNLWNFLFFLRKAYLDL